MRLNGLSSLSDRFIRIFLNVLNDIFVIRKTLYVDESEYCLTLQFNAVFMDNPSYKNAILRYSILKAKLIFIDLGLSLVSDNFVTIKIYIYIRSKKVIMGNSCRHIIVNFCYTIQIFNVRYWYSVYIVQRCRFS